MEADISIWRKTGHFYFALTRVGSSSGRQLLVTQKSALRRATPGKRNRTSSVFGFLTSKPQRIANRLEHCPLMVGSQDEVPIEEGWRFHNFPTDRAAVPTDR